MGDTITVVPITEERWMDFRMLWLRVRAERPWGHLDTLADAQAVDEREWRARLTLSRAGRSAVFAVERDDELIGTVAAYLDDEDERVAYLQHVEVCSGRDEDDVRICERLIWAVVDWARAHAVVALIAGVHEGRHGDLRDLLAAGFRPSGVVRPSGHDGGGDEIELKLQLLR